MAEKIKLQEVYPDGRIESHKSAAETFRNAVEYIGLNKVRQLGLTRNSINIVSTVEEVEHSTGEKKESLSFIKTDENGEEYVVCTQFGNNDKFRILSNINNQLNAGLRISKINVEQSSQISVSEEEPSPELLEGLSNNYNLTRYERNYKARKLCVEYYGTPCICQICGFDFEKVYGKREDAEPYIEVHHINPHASVSASGEHAIDCTRDLIPVCANCHSMLHHLKKKLLTPEELKAIIKARADK